MRKCKKAEAPPPTPHWHTWSISTGSCVGLVRGSFFSSPPASKEHPLFCDCQDSSLVLCVWDSAQAASLGRKKIKPPPSTHIRARTVNWIYIDNYCPSHSREKSGRETDLYSFRRNPCQLSLQTNTDWWYVCTCASLHLIYFCHIMNLIYVYSHLLHYFITYYITYKAFKENQ